MKNSVMMQFNMNLMKKILSRLPMELSGTLIITNEVKKIFKKIA